MRKGKKKKDSNRVVFQLSVKLQLCIVRSDQLMLGNQPEALQGRAVFGK